MKKRNNLKVFNTLSNKFELFVPIEDTVVKMYVCGPTVYSRPHIGNMRSSVVYDVIYRYLQYKYQTIIYVRNITDIDDKILNEAKKLNCDPYDLTKIVTSQFYEDCDYLLCKKPTIEPKATECIDDIIDIINSLIENGFAYINENHVLFAVDKHSKYGELSNRKLDEMIAGSRIKVESYKKHPCDFVLWKPVDKNELGWNTKFGYGRPGWHIECSAMSNKYLGKNFDIHGGGTDLQFPHHENEIAQSKCANIGSFFAKYWIHNGFLTVNSEKMSKSLGNFITCEDLRKKEINGKIVRLALLSTHYRKPIDFTDQLLHNAKITIEKFYTTCSEFLIDSLKEYAKIPDEAINALEDDFNIPEYISIMIKLSKNKDIASASQLYAMGELIGIYVKDDDVAENEPIPDYIIALAKKRKIAKAKRNYTKADELRNEIIKAGYKIEDLANGNYDISK